MRVAVLLHLFHHDLWAEFAGYIANLRAPFDLYVNLVDGNPFNEGMARFLVRGRFPEARVLETENRGRDIGGFLRLLGAVLESGSTYDSVILLHSKKSPRKSPSEGIEWRAALVRSLLGSPERADAIMRAFDSNPRLGMVGAKIWLFTERNRPELALSKNKPLVDEYCRRFGLRVDQTDFIAGTMFWARAKPFLGFFRKHDPIALAGELETGDHYDEDRPTRTHALERIFGYLVTSQGYRIEGLSHLVEARQQSA